jgi:hypothetical protein
MPKRFKYFLSLSASFVLAFRPRETRRLSREVAVDLPHVNEAAFSRLVRSEKSQAAELYDVDAIPAFFIIDEPGKIIYGDVSLDASVELVLAQKLGLIDEAAAGA